MGSRSGWRGVRLAVNTANLVASIALIAGTAWAWLGERGWPAPALVLRVYAPILGALRWYGAGSVGIRALGALISVLAVIVVLGCVLFSFKAHLEELTVMLLGVPFYLLIACSCFLLAGLVVSLFREVRLLL